MSNRFSPFPHRSGRYGAPMGRISRSIDPDTPLDKLAVAGPAGEYDSGGAYWGLPSGNSGPVWAVWIKGKGRDGVCYVRARGRESAKFAALYDGEMQIDIQPNGRVRAWFGDCTGPVYITCYGSTIIEAMTGCHRKILESRT